MEGREKFKPGMMMMMMMMNSIQCRSLSTTQVDFGKRNFRKFLAFGKRGSRHFKQQLSKTTDKDLLKLQDRGVRMTGVMEGNKFTNIPEMIPEICVPDLQGFELKPYVSYRVPDVIQGEFKPQDLFYAVYSQKIAEDFKEGRLDKDGNSLQPSEEELLTAEEARNKANSVGADKFSEKTWLEN